MAARLKSTSFVAKEASAALHAAGIPTAEPPPVSGTKTVMLLKSSHSGVPGSKRSKGGASGALASAISLQRLAASSRTGDLAGLSTD